jgi:hypothetical protein
MSANPHANGGKVLVDLDMPDFRDDALDVKRPASELHESTQVRRTRSGAAYGLTNLTREELVALWNNPIVRACFRVNLYFALRT